MWNNTIAIRKRLNWHTHHLRLRQPKVRKWCSLLHMDVLPLLGSCTTAGYDDWQIVVLMR
jgi:hypothetical protein